MPGGRGKINEYNNSLTPEQRKKHASKAGKAPKRQVAKTIRQIAQIINDAPAQEGAKAGLAKLGIKDEDMTNAALIAAAVFRAAFEGDMKAIDKWERYIGQSDRNDEDGNGQLADLIDGLKRKGTETGEE